MAAPATLLMTVLEPGAASVAPTVTAAPTITGNPQVGQVLTCVDGTATGTPAPTVSGRQWKRDGVNIAAATGTTYTQVTADATHTITVAVTWTNSGGSATGTSGGTGPIGLNYATGTDAMLGELCDNSAVDFPTTVSYRAGTTIDRLVLSSGDRARYLALTPGASSTSTRWRAPLLPPSTNWKGSQSGALVGDEP